MIIARLVKLFSFLALCYGGISGAPPSFYSPSSATTVTKNEDAAVGTQVYILVGTDTDGDALTYGKVSQTPSLPAFILNANSGVLTLPAGIDAETTKSFALQFSVSDGTSTVKSPILTVEIADVNDNSPYFSSSAYTATIYDTAAVNSVVTNVPATDPDSSDSLSFSLLAGNTRSTFAISSSSGQITVANPGNLNPSTTSAYTLTVQVSDGVHDAKASVTVTVLDDPCLPNPCINSGTCSSSGLNYTCSCTSGWMGTNCQTGFVGTNCRSSCSSPQDNSTDICDARTGDCLHGCQYGFAGANCSFVCPANCKQPKIAGNPTCNATNGACLNGCKDGYFGTDCTHLCSTSISGCSKCVLESNELVCTKCIYQFYRDNGACRQCSYWCRQECDEANGECINGCRFGRYGRFCDRICSSTCKDNLCSRLTGECLNGCLLSSYCGLTCLVSCSDRCFNRSCHQSCSCENSCSPNQWGKQCENVCAVNCRKPVDSNVNVCNTSDGTCLHGCLSHRQWGNLCTKPCSVGCQSGVCQQDTGFCTEGCVNSKLHGNECNLQCGSNCVNGTCRRDDGFCENGCAFGWFGAHCNLTCNANCFGGKCNRWNGNCVCEAGWYGPTCNRECDINCLYKACDRLTGECIYGKVTELGQTSWPVIPVG